MTSKKKIAAKRDISQESIDGARKKIHLAEAFPVKGGDFLPIRQHGWRVQTSETDSRQVSSY